MHHVALLPPSYHPAEDLAELRARYEHCYQCSLAASRRRIITGRGCTSGGLAILTDRVSGLDELEGCVLCGPAGEMLKKILAAPKVEIPLDAVYFTAVVLCRAPRDRLPRPQEIAACGERLRQELSLVRPRMIVALGDRAAKALFPHGSVLFEEGCWRETWKYAGGAIPVFRTTHPRELLWGSPAEVRRRKRMAYAHWQAISAEFHERNQSPPVNFAGEEHR